MVKVVDAVEDSQDFASRGNEGEHVLPEIEDHVVN